jgi:RNA polymerase sigma factor (TIGR02999 family)
MSDVTQILERVERGDGKAAEELLPLVYEELRRLAAARMAQEQPGQTLQPTALVHEAWLRLADETHWNNRQHFFRAAAQAMHRILVDRARQRNSQRRAGRLEQTELTESKVAAYSPDDELLAVHEALERLAQRDPVSADLVNLRYFVGMNMAQAAEALGIPLRAAERLWTFAKSWLSKEISKARF